MKRILLALAMIVCMPLCVLGAASVPQGNMTAQDPDMWDFGVAKAGVILEHTFALTNESGIGLSIKEATTSCGCTVSEIKKKNLKPGESTELLVKFDTKGYNGLTQQFVYVQTDSVEKPIVRFTVKANIVP